MQRKDTTINGNQYSILRPAVTKALPLCTRTAALLGPVLACFADKGEGLALQKLGTALQNVDPVKADALLMDAVTVCGLVDANNQPLTGIGFDKYFDEHREDVYQVMAWCLWETVKDFFPQLGTLGQQVLANAQSTLSKSGFPTDSATITG